MEIDIVNVEEFIKKYDCKKVISSNIFSSKSTEPDVEGLGSYEIFGRPGTPERKSTFGYIDLHSKFIHPHAFIVLVALARSIHDLVYGEADFFIEDGKLKKFTEGMKIDKKLKVGTGVDFLYEHYDELDFELNKAKGVRRTRIEFLNSLAKNEIFIDRWLVIPPYYRDVDMVSGKKNELNIMYSRLINYASLVKSSSVMFDLYSITDAHRGIMKTLVEMYNYFVGFNAGVHGFIHEHVMGKSTDFSARLVISTPSLNVETPDDMEVSFERSALPLSKVIKCFAPFIVHGVKKIVEANLSGSKYIYIKRPDGKFERKQLIDHFAEVSTSTNIYKLIEIYDNSKEHRLDSFTVETIDGEKAPLCYFSDDSLVSGNTVAFDEERMSRLKLHPMNLTELFYMAAVNECSDKHVFITRYPIEDYHNIYPSKITIIPCTKTKKRIVDEQLYERFPDFSTQVDIHDADKLFVDTLRIFPTYLKALGADFDGDMVSVQGVFSKEANEEASNYIKSLANIINIAGNTMRVTGDVTAHTLFGLTYGPDETTMVSTTQQPVAPIKGALPSSNPMDSYGPTLNNDDSGIGAKSIGASSNP